MAKRNETPKPFEYNGTTVHCPTCPMYAKLEGRNDEVGQCRANPPTNMLIPEPRNVYGPGKPTMGMTIQATFPVVNAETWCSLHPLYVPYVADKLEPDAREAGAEPDGQ